MRFSVLVETRLRPGIADPQGHTIERSLPALGFAGVSDMRVGKAFRFELESADESSARREVDEMTRRFLTNPVLEDADITISVVEPA